MAKEYVPKKITRFLALDLELNQPSNKIIQIGACVGDIETREILDTFSVFVNPNEELGYCNGGENDGKTITDLTGITQSDVDNGVNLREAYLQLLDFSKDYNCFINPVTWGGGDSEEIRRQLYEDPNNSDIPWAFGRRWIDAKTLFVSWRFANGEPIKGGLARSMLKLGLQFQGRKHDAEDDAINTLLVYFKLLDLLKGK